ncbi:MAG: uracil-DNA glycosylase [Thioploca sp.]|nr:uracil-DNA glycosylase [Thioploca sp.]
MGITVWVRRPPFISLAEPITPVNETLSTSLENGMIPSLLEDSSREDQTIPIKANWETLQQQVRACTACQLHQTRTQTVLGVGNRQADWMFIGEAPGVDEDAQGEPFVGRAGQLLNAMLYAIELRREEVYIANIIKCRPPNNRNPTHEESTRCNPFLQQQIALIKPKLIIALGRVAAQQLLATTEPIGQLRGRRFEYTYLGIPLIATYHPAYLLRRPTEKRRAWQDLQLITQQMTLLKS